MGNKLQRKPIRRKNGKTKQPENVWSQELDTTQIYTEVVEIS